MPYLVGRKFGPRLHTLVSEEDCVNVSIDSPVGDVVKITAEYHLHTDRWEAFIRCEMDRLEAERVEHE